MKTRHITTLLWVTTIGSCAAGSGFEKAGYTGWGAGLVALGTGLLLYLLFVRDD